MSQKNLSAIHTDSPLLPTSSSILPKKSSCITESPPLQPRFPTFLDSPSPPHSPKTPTQTYPPTFLLSPSLLSEPSDSPLLPSKDTSSTPTAPSDFGGAYPTPRSNLLSLYSPSITLSRLSWDPSFSTASTCVETNAAYTQQLSEILPDDMDLYSEDIDGYGLDYESIARGDAAGREPRGLGLELPFIADLDFAYYPNPGAGGMDMVVQTEAFGDSGENDMRVKEKKGGIRAVMGRLVRKGLRKIGVGKFA